MISWLISIVSPSILKRLSVGIGVFLLTSTIAFGYAAKKQYDTIKESQYTISSLESVIAAKEKARVESARLLSSKVKTERLLRHELDKLKTILTEIPDDGCLDRRIPDTVFDLLYRT